MGRSIARRGLMVGTAALGLALWAGTPARADTTLTVATAGDQNMVDYVNNYLGPKFEKQNPGVKVRAVGTGPGDGGSRKIFEKLSAASKAGDAKWDIDVAVIHQSIAGPMVQGKLLANYRSEIPTGKLVSSETASNALGANVDGYVMPMFQSQIAIAYNPAVVKNPPKTYDDLVAWAAKHPHRFGYNGIKGGMAGVGFVVGWVEAHSTVSKQLIDGPYDPALKPKIDQAMASIRNFDSQVTMTAGNAGTLDMLNRGEIDMGPVWVDMFYTWQHDGRLNPDMKLDLIGPGLPGQPMYYAVPAKAAHADLARRFIALATSPEVQANGIVKQFNWYPGIDAKYVQKDLDPKIWAKLFTDVTPQDLATKAKPFPLAQYLADIQESYERVAN